MKKFLNLLIAVGVLVVIVFLASSSQFNADQTEAASSTMSLVPATLNVPTLNHAAVKTITNKDTNIRKVEIEGDQLEIDYRQSTKILGFIPTKFNLHITADPSEKKLTVARPWWTIFSSTPARKILDTLRNNLTSSITTPIQALQTISKTMRTFNQTATTK